MRTPWIGTAWALAMLATAAPARACVESPPLVPGDIRYADVVVVGRIANYAIVPDAEGRRRLRHLLHIPADSPRAREMTVLGDYARFTILVDEVLAGRAGPTLIATWDNSTFPEPETMAPGPYLIALRDPRSRMPPLRGPSATILPNLEPGSLTLLQAPCSAPFLFEAGSEQAAAVRRILEGRPRAPAG